jgi:GT2 family glycosyltransferase
VTAVPEILHVDLVNGLDPLLGLPADGPDVHVELWLDGLALGQVELPRALIHNAPTVADLVAETVAPRIGELLIGSGFAAHPRPLRLRRDPAPVEFSELCKLANPLARLRELGDAARPDQLAATVSVIVCTRNRPGELERLLGSLASMPLQPTEIIVVDNAPTSSLTEEVVAAAEGCRYVLEPRPGLSIARNRGVRATIGDIVAFVDDDTVVHPDWLWRLAACFDSPDTMAVTGLVLPAALETEAQLAFQRELGGLNHGYRRVRFDSEFFADWEPRGVPAWFVGAGANMAFRREAFRKVGGFDERLGAGAAGCSEDSEIWYRLLADGWTCIYEPSAVVFHHHRDDWESLLAQARSYMRGHVAALFVQFARCRDRGNLHRALIALPRHFTRHLVREELPQTRGPTRTLRAQLGGYLSGLRFAPLALDNERPPRVD